jgi:hypothetical protein
MYIAKLTQLLLVFMLLAGSHSAQAIWFEASGQAVIRNGEKEVARQQATQEAIKQALLFAGASVKSVQSMANGLLADDRFEISSAGEVNNIELINEIYHKDYVTVSIRADIFPQEIMCKASDYKKNITSTWYKINKRQQAADGNLYDFGKIIAEKLQKESQKHGQFSLIKRLEPYYLAPSERDINSHAFTLAEKTDTQFVLFGEILEFAVETIPNKSFNFFKGDSVSRNLTLVLKMYDGNSGDLVFQDNQSIAAPWDFNLHQNIASNSTTLWNSPFGLATEKLIQSSIQKMDEAVSCLPAHGRIIKAGSEQLSVNIGKQNGVKIGDQLRLFQVNHFYDPLGKSHRQFVLHPEMVVVRQVFAETAIVASAKGLPLANIQANDFVARH